MKKLIFMMSVSLDGFFEGPDRDISRHRVDEDLLGHFNDELGAMSAFLDGRITYELMVGYWPTADQDPSASAQVVRFARIWREMPKIVYSRTIDHAEYHATVRARVDADEVRALKRQPGGDMVLGGAELAASFLKLDLIDEYRIYVHPIFIGAGRSLFTALPAPLSLRLVQNRVFGNGVVLLRYEPDRGR